MHTNNNHLWCLSILEFLSTGFDDRLDDDDIDLIEENLGVKVKRVNIPMPL